MNRTTQLQLFDQYTTHLRELTQSKGSDYAGTEDVLSNFKIAGDLMGISPSQQCLSMICTKIARLTALLRDGQPPKNESIMDSCLDAANYFFLLAMIEQEKQEEIPDEKEEAPLVYPDQDKLTAWVTASTLASGNSLRFSDTHRDGEFHFKVDVVKLGAEKQIFSPTVCTLDIQDCFETIKSRLGAVEYPNANRLDFRAKADHPRLKDVGTDEIVFDGWAFRLVPNGDQVDLLWSGDIPAKGI